ncbi:ABC transporter ATP-binding protein [Radicibacter daui]|uniref:ABC transporter ATP-binding protein n=1 Tax=Radicibacter daui TaxID=3064829 RepID=UPI004046A281
MSDVVSAGARPVLELSGVRRFYKQGGSQLDVLTGLDLKVMPGEMVALVGPSGSGKSTLLHICGLLDRPDEGSVRIGGTETRKLSEGARTKLRNSELGFVYQFHHLLPEFSAVENVALPQMIGGVSPAASRAHAAGLLEQVGLGHRVKHRPSELSGGEQQRVAIARALANKPRLLLADEPTGNLDEHTAEGVVEVLLQVVRETGLAALIATHNLDLARRMDRAVTMHEGKLAVWQG